MMRRGLLSGVLGLGVAVLLLGSFPTEARAQKAVPGWMTDYTAARAAAKRSGKPMLLVFR
jgi:hypothetical protein